MNLQALARDTTSSSSSQDPNFNNTIFEEKYNNGWLKKYFYVVLVFLAANLGNFINNLRLGIHYLGNPALKSTTNNLNSSGVWDGTYTYTYYNTIFYGLSLIILAAVALLAALGLFLQYQAIRLRSLQKQESAIKIITLFVIGQAGAALFSIICAIFTTPVSWISALIVGVAILAVGVVFRFLAVNVMNIMLGKDEESFKFDKSAFQA